MMRLKILVTFDQENTNGEKVKKRPTLTQSKKITVTRTSPLNKENDETVFRKSNGKITFLCIYLFQLLY